MIALDTNVVIRFLVRDDEAQSRRVYDRFKQAEAHREIFLVPLPVLLEILWVLESAYRKRRNEILDAVEGLKQMSILRFESEEVVQRWLTEAAESSADLPDLLIALAARSAGAREIMTLDRKAARHAYFRLLK